MNMLPIYLTDLFSVVWYSMSCCLIHGMPIEEMTPQMVELQISLGSWIYERIAPLLSVLMAIVGM